MSITTRVELNPAALVELDAAKRRGMIAAGLVVLEASNAQAPHEEGEPKHGVHMTETGAVRLEADKERVAIGYTAFWAPWQHEDLTYEHPNGHAKFLELALLENQETALEVIALTMRQAFGL